MLKLIKRIFTKLSTDKNKKPAVIRLKPRSRVIPAAKPIVVPADIVSRYGREK